MRKKTFLTVLLTALIFISATVLALTTVYRVSAVTLEISAISEEAKTEAATLEKEIASKYKGKNIFSVSSFNIGRKRSEKRSVFSYRKKVL